MPAQDPGSRLVGNGVRASSMRNRLKPEASLAASEDGACASASPSEAAEGGSTCQQGEQQKEEKVAKQEDRNEVSQCLWLPQPYGPGREVFCHDATATCWWRDGNPQVKSTGLSAA
jgi:hypothetical protein